MLKGNPNFQSILNWILQILHYYCRKQHKNIENSRIIEQNLVLSLPFSLFTATCAYCSLPQWQSFFVSWTQYSANFKRHRWLFVLYIVSFSDLKMVFSKLSQLDITACIKNCVYNNFNLVFGQLPPGKIAPRITAPGRLPPGWLPPGLLPSDNYPREKLPPG